MLVVCESLLSPEVKKLKKPFITDIRWGDEFRITRILGCLKKDVIKITVNLSAKSRAQSHGSEAILKLMTEQDGVSCNFRSHVYSRSLDNSYK